MAPELTERASRPLIYEKDPDVRHKAMEQIVKVAEEKLMDGKRPLQIQKSLDQNDQVISCNGLRVSSRISAIG